MRVFFEDPVLALAYCVEFVLESEQVFPPVVHLVSDGIEFLFENEIIFGPLFFLLYADLVDHVLLDFLQLPSISGVSHLLILALDLLYQVFVALFDVFGIVHETVSFVHLLGLLRSSTCRLLCSSSSSNSGSLSC